MSKQTSSAVRFSKKLDSGTAQDHLQSSHQNYNYFDRILQINTCPTRCPHATVDILGEKITGLLDSGASISVISAVDVLNRLNLKIVKIPNQMRVQTANGAPLTCLGFAYIPFRFNDQTRVIPTAVIPEISKSLILGTDFWRAFDIQLSVAGKPTFNTEAFKNVSGDNSLFHVTEYEEENSCCILQIESDFRGPEEVTIVDNSLDIPSFEVPSNDLIHADEIKTEHELTYPEKLELFEIVKKFPRTQNGKIGRTHLMQHKIVLNQNINDVKHKKVPLYPISPKVEAEVDKEIERLKSLDLIEECESEFINPLLPVKKGENKWRLCLDARRLNSLTKRDEYPFPNMSQILFRIQKSKYFTTIDLKDAYHQVLLHPDSRNLTAFRTAKGLFRYKTMPFGLLNSGATLSRLMTRVIGYDLSPKVWVYLDDIIITSDTLEEHLKLLEIVANRLRNANLTISIEKSKFCQKSVRYLGFILSENGISVDAAKIQPILDYPVPKCTKDVRRLLGLAGFYHRFIENYSAIVTPISDLLKKAKGKFRWTEQADASLLALKSALTSPPILANPNFNEPFTIETDSSDIAVGAVLTQNLNGDRRCIAYFSKKLSSTQKKYAATERECLGVLMAIDHFRPFIEGTQFTIMTDAMSLTFLKTMSINSRSPRIARWAMKIQDMDITFVYKKGKENITADVLSRSLNHIKLDISDVPYEELRDSIKKYPQKFKDFKVIEQKIYKFVTNAAKHDDVSFRWKYVPTNTERPEIIREAHCRAHLGFEKTLSIIQQKYFWPRMSADVLRHCKNCMTCKRSKVDNINPNPPCGREKVCHRPWEMISIDFLGPYPRSKLGNAYALVITDYFSKFTLIQVMRKATTAAVIQFLENNVFLLFGVPSILISDNGPQFVARAFKSFLEKYNVEHWNLASYRPNPNPTERVNRVIVAAIRSSLEGKTQKDWDQGVQVIASAIRNSVHDSTGYSPYFINFGRNMVSSGKEYEHLRDTDGDICISQGNIPKDMKHLYEAVRINLHRAYTRYSANYNLRSTRNVSFKKGEIVLKKNFFLSDKSINFNAKLAPKYTEAIVKRQMGSNTYELWDKNMKKRLGVFHSSVLKKID